MEFEEIEIENFCTIEHVKLKLNQPGLILVTGVNKDAAVGFESNGAGKSLLFDAICWCLWDETVRELSGDEVVRRRFGKDCCVRLKMKEGKNTYIVARHRKDSRIDKPNDLRLYVNGVSKARKMKQLQEVINGIIGFDFTTFCAMMPGAGINVATLTDSGIKELLEKLLQTEQLSAAYQQTRERLRALESTLSTNAAKQVAQRAALDVLEKEVGQLRELEQSFAKNKADKLLTLNERISALKTEAAACQVEIDRVPGLNIEVKKHSNIVADLNKQIDAIETPAKLRIKLLKDQLLDQDLQVAIAKEGVASCEKRRATLLTLSGTCPTCEAAITEDHLAAALQVVDTEKSRYLAAKAEWESKAKNSQREINEQTTRTAAEIASLAGLVQMHTMSVTSLQNAAKEASRYAQMLTRIQLDIVREEKALATVTVETHNFAAIFADKTKRVIEIVNDIVILITEHNAVSAEYKLCSFWVEGFSPAGLRSYMLDYVTPVLNDRASYYARMLTGNEMKVLFSTKTALKKGGDKDKFQIIVEYKHGGDVYKGTSKGEKARADLVIAMALGDLATFRTAKQLPWRFMDEPFESIDDRGNQSIMSLLSDQKERFKTVFVVTHKPAFKQLFHQRIVMTKENGVSTLTKDFQ